MYTISIKSTVKNLTTSKLPFKGIFMYTICIKYAGKYLDMQNMSGLKYIHVHSLHIICS